MKIINLDLVKAAIACLTDDDDGIVEKELIDYIECLNAELVEAGYEVGESLVTAENDLQEAVNNLDDLEEDWDDDLDDVEEGDEI